MGTSDGFCSRVRSTSPSLAPTSEASAGDTIDAVDRLLPVKAPEPIVDAVDDHVRRPAAGRLERHERVGNDQRCRGGCSKFFLDVRREVLTKEAHRRQHLIGVAETPERNVAKTAAHRVANHERPGQHGNRGGNAKGDGEIGPPVIAGAGEGEVD